jgi:hypothetical protein
MAKHKVANLKLTPRSLLSNEEFAAIGRMIVAFHGLEHQFLSILHAAGVGTKNKHLTFGYCRKLLDENVLPKIIIEKLHSELHDLLAEAKTVNDERNRIVHAAIGKHDGKSESMVALNSNLQANSKLSSSAHLFSASEIEELSCRINHLHGQFHGWFLKTYCPDAFE